MTRVSGAAALAAGLALLASAGWCAPESRTALDFTSMSVSEYLLSQLDLQPWILPRPDGGRVLELDLPPTADGWTQADFALGEEFLVADWRGWAAAELELENLGSEPVLVGLRWRNVPGSDADGVMAQWTAELAPHERARWRMPLLPLQYGQTIGDWPDQPGLAAIESDGHVDLSHVAELGFFADTTSRRRLRLGRLRLIEPIAPKGWIDRYGQVAFADPPEKVVSDADLSARDAAEQSALDASTAPADRDAFSAWTQMTPPAGAGGPFFRLARGADGRAWLVSPSHRPYFAACLGGITPDVAARWDQDRKAAYSWLPPTSGRFASAWLDAGDSLPDGAEADWPSFYRANLIRKWGPERADARFAARARQRLLDWGFTCVGPWSDGAIAARSRMPYFSDGPTMDLGLPAIFPAGAQAGSGHLPDVYDPAFPAKAAAAASGLAALKDDPFLVGHFFDEEPAWDRFEEGILALPDDQPARRHFLEFLAKRYGDVSTLNEAWGISAGSFQDVRDGGTTAQAQADWRELIADAAARYCRTLSSAVRSADPNHLLFGSRFASPQSTATVVAAEACEPYVDVVSIDDFSFAPRRLGLRKPYFASAYSFNSLDSGLLTAAAAVPSQEQRGQAYARYVALCASDFDCVGASYYQYIDEPVTGRADGDTSLNGFVTVADVPYAPLVTAARAVNAQVYELRSGRAKPIAARAP